MGHKVHPIGFRVGIIKPWDAKWYADKHYVHYLQEDLRVRKAVRSMYPEAGVSLVEIDRQANNVTLTIHTARPGILIGRGGQRVEEMRKKLEKLIGKRIQLNIREVQQPELNAFLVAKSVAEQMERRVAYRRAMKQTLQRTLQAGAKGMRIRCAGRLDGAEIARRVIMHEGRVPLHTIRADIDYGFIEARTQMGRIGVKVWIYKGDILPEKEEVEVAEAPVAEAAVAAPAAAPAPVAAAATVAAPATAPPAPAAAPARAAEAPAPATTAEVKPAAPRVVRRVVHPRTEATTPAPAAGEAKPATPRPVRRVVHPRTEVPATAETPAVEEKPKPAVKRTTRPAAAKPAAKPEDMKTEETAPPAEQQGDSNATT